MKALWGFAAGLALMAGAAELPVRNVTLYKHGVGYFQRSGEVLPGQPTRLDFRAEEMNDVLKSLTLAVEGGARMAGVRYDSSEPLSQKIGGLPLRLDKQQPLSALLDQLKGSRLQLRFGTETLTGVIVGARTVSPGREQPEREQVSLLLESGELRTLDLTAAAAISFPEPELQRQLGRYLEALSGARSTEKRSVYIDAAGSGKGRLTASYMIPVPVWKSSYRLVLRDRGEPLVEGWAIIDNTTGEDWDNVRLSLISGRPISFISNLYEPRYPRREVAELPETAAVAPVIHAGAVAESAALAPPEAPAAMAARPEVARRRLAAMELMRAGEPPVTSVEATADTRELGELFEYGFSHPVTVRRNESAMLPFLQDKIQARKLLIHSQESSIHPLHAVELVNTTGKTLDGGPVTVFDGNAYAGEALMETFKSNDKRLISYAVDLGTRLTTQFDSRGDQVREIHLRRGVLTARTAIQETRTYNVRNVDDKAKTLLIEHAARPDFKLLRPEAAEKTADSYRFEVKLQARGSAGLAVVEEKLIETTHVVASQTPDFLLAFIQNKELNSRARQQLERVLELKNRIAANARQVREAEGEIATLTRDQERIRQNLASLRAVSGQQEQVQIFARELTAKEARIYEVQKRLEGLRKTQSELESQLQALLESIEF